MLLKSEFTSGKGVILGSSKGGSGPAQGNSPGPKLKKKRV